VQLMTPTVF